MKFCEKLEGAISDSRERTADILFSDVGTVTLAIEGSDFSITEDNFVPTARCIQDTKKRQLVTRSSLQRLRCCVCHLHHEQAMKAPYRVRKFFAKVLKGGTTLLGWCHCWRCQCGNIQILQEAGVPRSVQLLGCRHVERDAARGQHGPPMWEQTSDWLFHQQAWHFLSGKPPGPRIMRRLWRNSYPRVLKLCSEKQLGRAVQIWKILAIGWLHLKTTEFINPDESWSFRTKISRYDPQIYPGTLLFLRLFMSCPSKLPWKVTCEAWSQGRSQEAEDSEK